MEETVEDFYKYLLKIDGPWKVLTITRKDETEEVIVEVGINSKEGLQCPVCGIKAKRYDFRIRRWRHLDSCEYHTLIEAKVPGVECTEHGIKQVKVPWAEDRSRFTAKFESRIIEWLEEASISKVARRFELSWDEVDGIQCRAVKRGLARRKKVNVRDMGIDETSFQKRHEYVTVLLDKEKDCVMDILDDRKASTLNKWFIEQEIFDLETVRSISMDMWEPFISAVKKHFANGAEIIAFDRFHVSMHLGKALDRVRLQENRQLMNEGIRTLIRSKHQWLRSSSKTDNRSSRRKDFMALTKMNLKTARAWRIKEAASLLWDYTYMGVAEKQWKKLLYWMSHSRLKPIIAVYKTIKKNLWGILNAIRLKANNSMVEAKNARIQRIKKIACGYRNKERFKTAILFHLGGLDLMPCST